MSGSIGMTFVCGRGGHVHYIEVHNVGQSATELVPCGWLVKYSRSGDQLDIICPKCQDASQREWMRQQTDGKSAIDAEIIDVVEEPLPQLQGREQK